MVQLVTDFCICLVRFCYKLGVPTLQQQITDIRILLYHSLGLYDYTYDWDSFLYLSISHFIHNLTALSCKKKHMGALGIGWFCNNLNDL